MLVIPEDSVDQQLNAHGVENLGIGMQVSASELSVALIKRFLSREKEFAEACARNRRDATKEVGALIRKTVAQNKKLHTV